MTFRSSRRAVLLGVAGIPSLAGCGYQPAGGERVWTETDRTFADGVTVATDRHLFAVTTRSGLRHDWEANEWYDAEETIVRVVESDGSSPFAVRFEPQFAGSPVVAGDRLVVPTDDGDLVAIDLDPPAPDDPTESVDRIAWRLDRTGPPLRIGGGRSGLIATDGAGTLRAYDAASGDRRWERSVGGSAAVPIAVADTSAYLLTADDKVRAVVAIDLADGSRRWSLEVDGDTGSPLTGVQGSIATDSTLIVSLGSGESSIAAIDVEAGTTRWRADSPIAGSPIATGGRLFVPVPGGFDAYDLETGDRLWSLPDRYRRTAGPVADADGVYAAGAGSNRDGPRLVGFSHGGAPLWDVPIGDDVGRVEELFRLGSRLVVRSGFDLYGFRTAPGRRWSILPA
ncbi:MAG: PQQ-binding-like beta-propeller repeat protein [Halobacteriota archaeon]